jgi:hypothetical protein
VHAGSREGPGGGNEPKVTVACAAAPVRLRCRG